MIIGLCGKAGAGKDTVALRLAEAHGYTVTSFAQPIYEAVSAITGIPVEKLRDRTIKELVIPWIGKSPRQLLQTLGEEWGRQMVHRDLWVRACFNRIHGLKNVVICDVRYDNEAEAIRRDGGCVWLVDRPGAGLDGETGQHTSEAGVSHNLIHAVIDNSGSLIDLEDTVDGNVIARLTCSGQLSFGGK